GAPEVELKIHDLEVPSPVLDEKRAHVAEPDVRMRHGMKPNVILRHPLFLQELLDGRRFLLILDRQIYLDVPREGPDDLDLDVLERPSLDILDGGPTHPDRLVRLPLGGEGES